jgi:hypothetical protein
MFGRDLCDVLPTGDLFLSLCVIRYNKTPLHLKFVGKRGRTKKATCAIGLLALDFHILTHTTHAGLHEYLPITVMLEFRATVAKFGASVDTSHL